MNLGRVLAIFQKDLKDFMKNMSLIFMPLLPIILSALYARLGSSIDEEMPLAMIYIVVGTTYAAVTAGCIMVSMAEENEKKTLRGLIMSPASYGEIITGKSLVTALMTIISLVISVSLMGGSALLDVQQIIGLILLFFFFLFLGIGFGLYVKTIAMTTPYLMPIMFIFGFTPMIESLGFSGDSMVTKVADAFPIMQMLKLEETSSWVPLIIVAIWTLAAAMIAFFFFQRATKDRA